jgi:NAD(P)H-flavin reductase
VSTPFAEPTGSPSRPSLFNKHPDDRSRCWPNSEANQHFRFVPTMTEMAKSHQDWKWETGFIDQQMLTRFLPGLHGPIYYVAGPPAMVAAMRQMLLGAGVDEDDVRTEEFAGY